MRLNARTETLGQTWVYAQLAKGFPRPIGLEDGQSLGWVESEVDDWLQLVARRDELAAANPGDPFAATGAKQVRLREARVKKLVAARREVYQGREGRCTIAAEAR